MTVGRPKRNGGEAPSVADESGRKMPFPGAGRVCYHEKTKAMTTSAEFDMIGLGYSAVDYLGTVPHLPALDSKLEMIDFSRQGGGPVSYTH